LSLRNCSSDAAAASVACCVSTKPQRRRTGYTYRQKLQRAFAAELLCPLSALEEKLGGDYLAEAREDAAHHFAVSERTVTAMLVNHRLLDRDYLDGDPEILAA
jgi:Zn-dependent peptidase ImmA (M78 family)